MSFTVITYVESHVAASRLSRILHCAVTAMSISGHGQGTVRSRARYGTFMDRARYGHGQVYLNTGKKIFRNCESTLSIFVVGINC